MNRFSLQLEALGGRDMPSAGWAFDVVSGGEPVVETQRIGSLAGGVEGTVGVAGGALGGVTMGGARGGIVDLLGGASGGVLGDRMRLGGPDDSFAAIDVDGSVGISTHHIGEEIPQSARSKGEEIPSFMSAGVIDPGEEIPT